MAHGKTRTIYVSDSDMPLWEEQAINTLAERLGMIVPGGKTSASAVVRHLLLEAMKKYDVVNEEGLIDDQPKDMNPLF